MRSSIKSKICEHIFNKRSAYVGYAHVEQSSTQMEHLLIFLDNTPHCQNDLAYIRLMLWGSARIV